MEKVFPAESYTESYVSLVLEETEAKWRQEQEQKQKQQGEAHQQQSMLMQQLLQMQEQRRQLETVQQQIREQQQNPQRREALPLDEELEEASAEREQLQLTKTLGAEEASGVCRVPSRGEEGPVLSSETLSAPTLRLAPTTAQQQRVFMPPHCVDGHFGFVVSEAFSARASPASLASLCVIGQYGFVEASAGGGKALQGRPSEQETSAGASWIDGQFGFVRTYSKALAAPDLLASFGGSGFATPFCVDGQFGFVRTCSDWEDQQRRMLLQLLPRAPDAVFGAFGFVSPFDVPTEDFAAPAAASNEAQPSGFEAIFGGYGFVSLPSHTALANPPSVPSSGYAAARERNWFAVDGAYGFVRTAGIFSGKTGESSEKPSTPRAALLPSFVGVDGFYGTVRETTTVNSLVAKQKPCATDDAVQQLIEQLRHYAVVRRPLLPPASEWLFVEILAEKGAQQTTGPTGAPRRWLAAEALACAGSVAGCASQGDLGGQELLDAGVGGAPSEKQVAAAAVSEEPRSSGKSAASNSPRGESLAGQAPCCPPSRSETAALLQLLHALAAACAGALDVFADVRPFALQDLFDSSFAVDSTSSERSVGRGSNAGAPENGPGLSVGVYGKTPRRAPSPAPAAASLSPFSVRGPLDSGLAKSGGEAEARLTEPPGKVGVVGEAWRTEAPFRPLPTKQRQQQQLLLVPAESSAARLRARSASPGGSSKQDSQKSALVSSDKSIVSSAAGKATATGAGPAPSTVSPAHGRKVHLLQVLRLFSLLGSFRPEKQHVFREAELLPRMEALLALLLDSTSGASNVNAGLNRKPSPAPKTGGSWLTVSLHPVTVPTVWDCGKKQLLQHQAKASASVSQLRVGPFLVQCQALGFVQKNLSQKTLLVVVVLSESLQERPLLRRPRSSRPSCLRLRHGAPVAFELPVLLLPQARRARPQQSGLSGTNFAEGGGAAFQSRPLGCRRVFAGTRAQQLKRRTT